MIEFFKAGGFSMWVILGFGLIAFVAAALFLSRTAAPVFDWVVDRLKAPGDVAVASFVVLTLCCFAATAIGLEAALGAFAAGLILSKSNHTHAIEAAVKPVVALFATIFFVLIGTGMDLSVLNPFDAANREGLIVAVFLLVVAVVILTSLLLFPVILRLARRLAAYSGDLLEANLEMMEVLGCAIAKRDSATDAHNYRVTIYAVRLAEQQ